ncbi:LytR family transcriptional regulator, partial [Staphylococcus xylosus]
SYLKDDIDIKSTQLEGKDDYLNGLYYYNPDIKNIQDTSNLLRDDLELPKIKDKLEFLNQRVIDFYGTLIPQTEIDSSLLRKSQNDSTSNDDNDENQTSDNNSTDSDNQINNNNENSQQSDANQYENQQDDPNQQNSNQNTQQQIDPNQQQPVENQQPNAQEIPTNQY